MSETYIMIEDKPYQTNTDEQVFAARAALRQAGIECTDEYAGLPDGQGDSYPNGNKLFAAAAPLVSDGGRFATAKEYFESAEALRKTLENHGRHEWAPPVRLAMQLLYETAKRIDLMAELQRLQTHCTQLEQQNMQLQIQNQLLQQMIGAGVVVGESLGDESCGFIDGDDVPCTSPATQLLIDPSGVRCPVCDEHARTAPPDLKKVRPS